MASSSLVRAAALVRSGRIYTLSHPLEPGMPQPADAPSMAWTSRLSRQPHVVETPSKRIYSETVHFHTHTGTHIDAFAHHLAGGDAIDALAPLAARGVLIDAASARKTNRLEANTLLQPSDLQRALTDQGGQLEAGDIVLVRTGWAQLWPRPLAYMVEAPGLSADAARWLADQGCQAIGADQWSIDAAPSRDGQAPSCHTICLVQRGLPLIENLNLEELARQRVYSFFFVALAPPFKDATGFPCQALAIV